MDSKMLLHELSYTVMHSFVEFESLKKWLVLPLLTCRFLHLPARDQGRCCIVPEFLAVVGFEPTPPKRLVILIFLSIMGKFIPKRNELEPTVEI